MDILDEGFINFWKGLNRESVKYLMIGGFAVNIHGFNRHTGGIDIWVEDSPENRNNLGAALEKLRIAPLEIVKRMQFVPGWTQMTLPNGFPLDIMTNVKGLEGYSFDQCLEMAVWAEIESIKVPFIHLNQLIMAKEAARRPKDLIDIEELKRIDDLQKKINNGEV
jgi:predicted nucleotidyltransferase